MTKFNPSEQNKSLNTKEKYKRRVDGSDNVQDVFHHLESAYNQIYELSLQCQACKPKKKKTLFYY